MKSIYKTSVIAIASAIFGAVLTYGAVKYTSTHNAPIPAASLNQNKVFDDIIKSQQEIDKNFDALFDKQFFKREDPFNEMKKMRDDIGKRIAELSQGGSPRNPFDAWFSEKYGTGSLNDISKREDADYVYYDIKVENLNETSIHTNILNGQITISGTTEKKDEKNENGVATENVYKSTFEKTFPLPENVDQHKMQMSTEKDKVVLKFPKSKT
jgi:HSP20 family molecular chaperone IbpA